MRTNPSPRPRQRTAVLESIKPGERLAAAATRCGEFTMRRRDRGNQQNALRSFYLVFLAYAVGGSALAQAQRPDLSLELVDPKVLRVCADPRNMPFSDEQGEGFENKLAELLAQKLGKSLAYVWYPQATGFVRNTLGAHKCDVIMGFPQGNDIVQSTNPYYRTSYALMFKSGNGLDGVETLTDARLKGRHIGIVAGTPPSNYLAAGGLMTTAKPYPLVIDTRVDSSAQAM